MSPPSERPLLSLQGLRIERGNRTILGGLDWSIGPDENWAILGPNGCGKTSLLRAIFGYLPATAGTITALGNTFGKSDWPRLRNQIGLLSQSLLPRIPDDQTLAEVILSGPTSQLGYWGDEMAEENESVQQLLKTMAFAGRGLEPWSILSQGERQRALLARALYGDRRLLFLDEPCAGLDPVARESFLSHLQMTTESRQTPPFVIVTHHLEELIPSITHVLLLREGRAVASGPKASTVTTENLRDTFGADVRVARSDGRYCLSVKAPSSESWFSGNPNV